MLNAAKQDWHLPLLHVFRLILVYCMIKDGWYVLWSAMSSSHTSHTDTNCMLTVNTKGCRKKGQTYIHISKLNSQQAVKCFVYLHMIYRLTCIFTVIRPWLHRQYFPYIKQCYNLQFKTSNWLITREEMNQIFYFIKLKLVLFKNFEWANELRLPSALSSLSNETCVCKFFQYRCATSKGSELVW